jgi:hypothetical protein
VTLLRWTLWAGVWQLLEESGSLESWLSADGRSSAEGGQGGEGRLGRGRSEAISARKARAWCNVSPSSCIAMWPQERHSCCTVSAFVVAWPEETTFRATVPLSRTQPCKDLILFQEHELMTPQQKRTRAVLLQELLAGPPVQRGRGSKQQKLHHSSDIVAFFMRQNNYSLAHEASNRSTSFGDRFASI